MALKVLYLVILTFFKYEVSSECQPSITTASGPYAPSGVICSGDLIFDENFDVFDLNLWAHEQTLSGGSTNNQFQWYTNNRSNTYAEDGILHVKPTLLAEERGEEFLYSGTIVINQTDCTIPANDGCTRTGTQDIILNPIKSARIHTTNSFAFKYGNVQIRAKFPAGDWLWPALWMEPKWRKYSGWPVSGEIDIAESRGNRYLFKDSTNIGVQELGSVLHWGPNAALDRYRYTIFETNNAAGWNAAYHIYELLWRPENISFFIDTQHIGTITPPSGGFWELGELNSTGLANPWINGTRMAPFDDEFFFIINMAVGGTSFFPDSAQNLPLPKPWKNNRGRASMTDFWKAKDQWLPTWLHCSDESHLKVDYIKVTAL